MFKSYIYMVITHNKDKIGEHLLRSKYILRNYLVLPNQNILEDWHTEYTC